MIESLIYDFGTLAGLHPILVIISGGFVDIMVGDMPGVITAKGDSFAGAVQLHHDPSAGGHSACHHLYRIKLWWILH